MWLKNSFLVSELLKAPLYSAVIVVLLVSLIPLDETHKCTASITTATSSVSRIDLSSLAI
jgi:hypothetical protein